MDLMSFLVINEVTAARYVLPLSLQLNMSFRAFIIYRMFSIFRPEWYGNNVFPCDKLSYCCTSSSACMFALTNVTSFSMINFPFSMIGCEGKFVLIMTVDCVP